MTAKDQHEVERTAAAIMAAVCWQLTSGCPCDLASIAQKAGVRAQVVDEHFHRLGIELAEKYGNAQGVVLPPHPVDHVGETLKLQQAVADAWVALRLVPATPELQQVRQKLNAIAAITHFPPSFDTTKWTWE